MKASASSSVMGFHQSGSLILIRPFSVPNFGFFRLEALVRTMSTVGTPRRQIVTVSPFSTASMSSGSLFLASATLTFVRQ
jgi:hypothetical protein